MNRVAVLMSTYNGERFLREQIDSILSQNDVEVELFVRDDGSKDGTEGILSEYAEKYANVHYKMCENAGVGNSFMNLLYSVPADFDYYAFSDQDDIWLPEKLSEAVKAIGERNALLYASNQRCVDKDGKELFLRYGEETHINQSPEEIMTCNMVSGCTMVFGNKFYRILTEENHRPSAELLKNRIHDVWLAEVASLYGGLFYDKRAFILYRQHENNVVGAYKAGFFKRLKEKFKKLKYGELRCGRSKLAREICEKFPAESKNYPLLEICANSEKCKGKRKILKSGKQLRKFSDEGRFTFFVKVIMGWF